MMCYTTALVLRLVEMRAIPSEPAPLLLGRLNCVYMLFSYHEFEDPDNSEPSNWLAFKPPLEATPRRMHFGRYSVH